MRYKERRIFGVGKVDLVAHGYLDALQVDLYRTSLIGIVTLERLLRRLAVILKRQYSQVIQRKELEMEEFEQSLEETSVLHFETVQPFVD